MKWEKMNDTDYKIILFQENDEIEEIKNCLKKIQKLLKLKGFYQVMVTPKKCGLFLQLMQKEESFYKNTVDFRIEKKEEDIYYETKDYFLIKDLSMIYYIDEKFYGLVDDSFDKVLEKVEFGKFLFGGETLKFLENSIMI